MAYHEIAFSVCDYSKWEIILKSVSSPGKRELILPATGWEIPYCLPVKHGSLLLLSKCLPEDSK